MPYTCIDGRTVWTNGGEPGLNNGISNFFLGALVGAIGIKVIENFISDDEDEE